MKRSWLGLLVGMLVGLQGVAAVAREEPSAPSEQNPKNAPGYSGDIEEILKLVNAGVSKEVVMAYIEHSPRRLEVSAAGIVTLKEHAVPDEVTLALVKRWAAQTRNEQENAAPEARGVGWEMNNPPRQTLLDPEGYAYWWYYYAYPRTLAAANERLLSSYYSGYPGFVGYPSSGFYQYAPWPARGPVWERRFHHGR